MGTKLCSVNPYLRDPVARKRVLIRSVVTSSTIDGIRAVFKQARRTTEKSPVRRGRVFHKKV